MLFKAPPLKLSHSTFWIEETGGRFIEIEESINLEDSGRNGNSEGALVMYCGVPGIIGVQNVSNGEEGVSKVLVEPKIFVHDHPTVIRMLGKYKPTL